MLLLIILVMYVRGVKLIMSSDMPSSRSRLAAHEKVLTEMIAANISSADLLNGRESVVQGSGAVLRA